ncbi:MAG: ABC transporter ATP-binding protein [Clostridia bacterium]
MKPLKWIFTKLRKEKYIVGALCVINLLISLCVVGFALMTKRVIDVATGDLASTLLKEGIILFSLIGVRIILGILNNRLQVLATAKSSIRLQKEIYIDILNKKLRNISAIHSGDVLNRLTSDIDIVTGAFVNIPVNTVSILTRIIAGILAMVILDPLFTLAIVIIGVLVFLITRFFSNRFKSIHKFCQQINGDIRSFINETIQNITVIKSFNGTEKMSEKLDLMYEKSLKLQLKKNVISTVATMGTYTIFSTSYYIALCIGAMKLISGSITVGTLMGFLQLISQVQTPFQAMSGIFPQFYAALASTERLLELSLIENEEVSTEQITQVKQIEFKDVSFAYDEELVIKNANFTINKGDFIYLMGSSGIGKSTIIKLLLAFEKPSSGEILADKVTIGAMHRSLFSYVPQGNLILSGSIKENVIFCTKTPTTKEIENALKQADAYDFVMSLPKGLDTIIGEKGFGLSEGQVQRIAIARAILYDAEILLLDEATSALDIQTEKTVLNNLKKLGKTVFFISHKKNAVDLCNKVLKIEKGEITQEEII